MPTRFYFSIFIFVSMLFAVNGASSQPSKDNYRREAWAGCQSSDPQRRLVDCTIVISANGFGSDKRLADALDSRCWAYTMKQNFDAAIIDCRRAIGIAPRYAYAYANLGNAYLGKEDYRLAIGALDQAIQLKPAFIWSYIYIEFGLGSHWVRSMRQPAISKQLQPSILIMRKFKRLGVSLHLRQAIPLPSHAERRHHKQQSPLHPLRVP